MGSKPSSQTNTTSSTAPPSWVTSALQSTLGRAQKTASTPYNPYSGQLVAPVNEQQTTGINAINSASGVQNPYNASALGLGTAGAGAINPSAITSSTIGQYESPYQQDVINATEGEINNQNQQQSAALTGSLAASGALGGDRAGIAQAALAGQQDLASNATLASLNNQNYEQALGEANTQQQTALGAAQNTAARQLQAGTNLGTLGSTAQNEALNEGSAQTAAGTLQQQTSQAADTANYNQYLQRQAYPFQTTSWLAGILGGLGGLAGSTTNQDQTQYTSGLSSILGAGLGLASLIPKARGGRISHYAAGGGLGGVVTPYSDATGMIAPGAGSWVPTGSSVVGHLAQSGGMGGAAGAAQGQNGLTSMAQTAKGIQGLGTGLTNAFNGLGDLGSDASLLSMPEGESLFPGGLARGGAVRHYDDGGNVSANDLLFDPSALDDSGLGAARSIPNVAGSSPPVAQYIPNASDVPSAATPISANGGGLGAASSSASDPTFQRMLAVESNNRQFAPDGNTVTSPAGAEGIAQIEPSTGPEAAALAGLPWDPKRLATDANYNAALGRAYYNHQLATFGSPDLAAAAYNAGPGAVSSALGKADKFGGSYLDYLSPETRAYVSKIAGNSPVGLGGAAMPADALAYGDNAAPQNPITGGLGAIAGLLSGGHGATSSGAYPQSNLGFLNQAVGASPQEGGGLFNLSPNTRLGLLAAGLGMMGGTSVNPWVNIGRGGLEGIQTMMEGAKNASGIGLQQAQTQQVKTQTQLEQQKVGMMMNALNQLSQLQKNKADQISKATAANPATSTQQPINPALQTIPGSVAPAPMAPVAGTDAPANQGTSVAPTSTGSVSTTSQKQIDPAYDPAYLRQQAQIMNFVNPQMASNYRDQAAQIESGKAMVRFTDGSYGFMPGYNQAAAGQAATIESAKTNASEAAKSNYDLVEVQPTPGGPTQYVPKSQLLNYQKQNPQATPVGVGAGSPPGAAMNAVAAANPIIAKQPAFIAKRQEQIATDEDQMTQQFRARQLSKQRLGALETIMQNFQPGAFAEQKASIIANLRAVGINFPSSATASPEAFEQFTKNAIANVFNDVKGMGGRVLMSEIQGLTKANANPELQPQAAAAIIAQGLGVINYEDQHFKDYMAWKAKNPNAYNTSSFEIPWQQTHPVQQFVNQAEKGFAYKGQAIPPKNQLVDGQSYMTARGPAKWNAARGVFVPARTQ